VVPSNAHRLLRGPSVYSMRPAIIAVTAVLGIGIVAVLATAVQIGPNASLSELAGFTVTWAMVLGWGFVFALVLIVVKLRTDAEVAAGYTTTPFGFPEVDLADPRTGAVLRHAGEPLIDKKTFLRLRQEARLEVGARNGDESR
jgi:hypothetical protein